MNGPADVEAGRIHPTRRGRGLLNDTWTEALPIVIRGPAPFMPRRPDVVPRLIARIFAGKIKIIGDGKVLTIFVETG